MKYDAGAVAFLAVVLGCAVVSPTARTPDDAPDPVTSDTPADRRTAAGGPDTSATLAFERPRRARRAGGGPSAATGPLRVDLDALSDALLAAANRARARAGVPPLVTDPLLARAARRYSRELARRRAIEHASSTPGRRTFRQRIEAEGARARIAGENLARLTTTRARLPGRVVELWLESPGHRSNLLYPSFRRTGIGVWLGADGIWYVVQVYATAP